MQKTKTTTKHKIIPKKKKKWNRILTPKENIKSNRKMQAIIIHHAKWFNKELPFPPRTQTCPHTRAAGLRPWKSHSKPLGTYTDSACPKQWGPGLTRCPGGPHYAFWCHSEITRLPSTHPPSIPALCSAFLVWIHYISTSSLKPQSSLTEPGCPLVQIHFSPNTKNKNPSSVTSSSVAWRWYSVLHTQADLLSGANLILSCRCVHLAGEVLWTPTC